MHGIGINAVPASRCCDFVCCCRFYHTDFIIPIVGGWDSRLQIITIACALHCYAMQENTELTAYDRYSIRQRWFGKKMHHNDTLTIDNSEDGTRLDRVLMRHLGPSRRTLILRLIRKGNVRVNKKRRKPESRVASGDRILLPLSLRETDQQNSADIPAS